LERIGQPACFCSWSGDWLIEVSCESEGGLFAYATPCPLNMIFVYICQMFRGQRKGKIFSPPLTLSHLLLGPLSTTYIMLLFHFLHPLHSRPKHQYSIQFDCSYFVIVCCDCSYCLFLLFVLIVLIVIVVVCYYCCLLLLFVIIVCYIIFVIAQFMTHSF
jgi:hypothetical protein